MPTNESVWEADAPSSTEQSTRAFMAAQEQDQGQARNYLRELRITAQVEGKNVENPELLLEAADEVGLDSEQLQQDMGSLGVEETKWITETPVLDVTIDDVPRTWEGYIEFERARAAFLGHRMQPESVPQSVYRFVAEHGPVATEKVAEAFEMSKEQVLNKLRNSDRIQSMEFESGTFWRILSSD